MAGKIFRIVGFSVIGLVVLFGLVFLLSPRVDYQNPERLRPFGTEVFEPERWVTSRAEERGRLLYDFVKRGLYVGKTEAELLELLGPPTGRYLTPENLAYQVGPPGVKSRFGERFTFALVKDKKSGTYRQFWIEPFPEEHPDALPSAP